MNYQERYMEILLRVAINIQQGESLSINTNPGTLEFAKDLAQLASETTLQPVHVVLVDQGKPGDVVTFTPIEHEQLSSTPIRAALLRLDDTEDRQWDFTIGPQQMATDMSLLQRAGNLAPPQLDKQVAPWSIVAVPGPNWAKRLLGKQATEAQLWELLSPVFKLDSEDPQQAWREHVSMIDHRLAVLNRLDAESFEISTTAGTRLILSSVEGSRWRGGVRKLDDGRAFIPHLPLDRVSMLVERTITNGVVHTTKPFPLLGGYVEHAVLEFHNGSIVSFDADKGKDLLEIAFSIDAGARKLGECSLVEHGSTLAEISHTFGYRGFDENFLSTLTLGMGEAYHLEALDRYSDEEELQEQTGCNVSTLRMRIPIGDSGLCVGAQLFDGSSETIMQNGQFIL